MRRTIVRPENRGATMRITASSEPDRVGAREPAPQVDELLELLSSLQDLLRQLTDLAETKLQAMREADVEGLHRCAARECQVLERLFEREQSRDAVLARVAQALRYEPDSRPRLAEVAEKLAEPHSSRLRAKIAGLRHVSTELRQKNRLAAEVARHLHQHIRAVFEDLAQVNRESVVYGPNGQHEQRINKTWVDAVG